MKIGINGFGRIGRCILRSFYERNYKEKGLEITAINSRSSSSKQSHLLKYDSIHGTFGHNVTANDGFIEVNGDIIRVLNEKSPEDIKWDVDVVFECSGVFNKKEKAGLHNAQHVIVSAPVDDAEQTIIYGVNHRNLEKNNKVISCGSCTTNCLAPIAAVIDNNFGIAKGFMTTVHAYTNDQNIIDNSHKDMRRARACGLSMIPTSTGATKTIGKIIPGLAGKIDGVAVRVPVPNVSMIDFTCITSKKITVEQLNDVMRAESEGNMSGVIATCDEELVSIDFNHNPHSAIFDCTQTKVIGDDFIRVLAWYDNEWGFSNRMLDLALLLKL